MKSAYQCSRLRIRRHDVINQRGHEPASRVGKYERRLGEVKGQFGDAGRVAASEDFRRGSLVSIGAKCVVARRSRNPRHRYWRFTCAIASAELTCASPSPAGTICGEPAVVVHRRHRRFHRRHTRQLMVRVQSVVADISVT